LPLGSSSSRTIRSAARFRVDTAIPDAIGINDHVGPLAAAVETAAEGDLYRLSAQPIVEALECLFRTGLATGWPGTNEQMTCHGNGAWLQWRDAGGGEGVEVAVVGADIQGAVGSDGRKRRCRMTGAISPDRFSLWADGIEIAVV